MLLPDRRHLSKQHHSKLWAFKTIYSVAFEDFLKVFEIPSLLCLSGVIWEWLSGGGKENWSHTGTWVGVFIFMTDQILAKKILFAKILYTLQQHFGLWHAPFPSGWKKSLCRLRSLIIINASCAGRSERFGKANVGDVHSSFILIFSWQNWSSLLIDIHH